MARKNSRTANGAGSIRQRSDGRWEARYTAGTNPGTGKPIRRSIYGVTQGGVKKRLTAILHELDEGTYTPPQKMKLSAWLDIWLKEYVENSVKPNTYRTYKVQAEAHIKPALGATELSQLTAHSLQTFYNKLLAEGKRDHKPMSSKSVRNVHGVVEKALAVAVRLGYIRSNPAADCELPRHEKKKMQPLDEDAIKRFLKEIEDEPFKNLFTVALFTGLRQAELLGLQWSCVNFTAGTVTVDKQLLKIKEKDGPYILASTKTDNIRMITPAPYVMAALKDEQVRQLSNKFKAGGKDGAFSNPDDLVFTDELGKHLVARTVVKHYKAVVTRLGLPDKRFHDLRHSYATMALKSGDSIKDVQTALGHTTSGITLDLYSHVTPEMNKESAARMESFIQSVKQA